jgi:hypothetical protein
MKSASAIIRSFFSSRAVSLYLNMCQPINELGLVARDNHDIGTLCSELMCYSEAHSTRASGYHHRLFTLALMMSAGGNSLLTLPRTSKAVFDPIITVCDSRSIMAIWSNIVEVWLRKERSSTRVFRVEQKYTWKVQNNELQSSRSQRAPDNICCWLRG